jgi:hypothetical protein
VAASWMEQSRLRITHHSASVFPMPDRRLAERRLGLTLAV